MSTSPAEESSERLNDWSNKWKGNETKWHQTEVNHALLKYGDRIIPNFNEPTTERRDTRIFVPLCGKTVDMAFLAKHGSISEVVGVEGIQQALTEFSDENPDLDIKEEVDSKGDGFDRFVGKNISLLKGDFFAMTQENAGGKFDVVWDRASLVAIRPELREDYVGIMKQLVKPGGHILLSTLDRRTGDEEAINRGAPFTVPEAEVRRLYEGQDWVESVELIEEIDAFELIPDYRKYPLFQGLTSLYELAFDIKIKN